MKARTRNRIFRSMMSAEQAMSDARVAEKAIKDEGASPIQVKVMTAAKERIEQAHGCLCDLWADVKEGA